MLRDAVFSNYTVITAMCMPNHCTLPLVHGLFSNGDGYSGTITPNSTKRHRYILAVTDYFSKRAKVVALREIKASDIIWFINVHLIYRFGVLDPIIINNGQPFVSSPLY